MCVGSTEDLLIRRLIGAVSFQILLHRCHTVCVKSGTRFLCPSCVNVTQAASCNTVCARLDQHGKWQPVCQGIM